MIIKIKHIVFILIFILPFGLISQDYGQKKSSFKINKKSGQVEETVSLVDQIKYAEKIFSDSTSKAIDIVEGVLYSALKQKKKYEEALAYKTLGNFNSKLKSYDLASYNYGKAIPIFLKLNQTNLLNETYLASATSHYNQGHYNDAIEQYKASSEIAIKHKNILLEIKNKLAIGDIYFLKKEYNQALEYFRFCETKSTQNNYKNQLIQAKIGVGKVLNAQGQYKKAESIIKEANKLAEEYENDYLANESFDLLAKIEQNQNNTEDNIYYQQQAYSYNSSRGNYDNAIQNSSSMANTYLEQNRTKEAMEVLENSNELVQQSSNVEVKKEFYKTLSTLYETQGKKEEAEEVNKQYNALEDSLLALNLRKELALQTKTELLGNAQNRLLLLEKDRELNEKEIQLLKQEKALQESTIKRQTIITYSLALGLLIILLLSFFIYKNNKEKQISNQLLILKSLRNQMNPHFIFNSLNSVNSFIAKQDERSANKYLAEFSKLMREVLEYSQEDFIPLSKEVEILQLYLNLEHFRFKNDFDFTFELDKNIKLDEYQIPPMLLQPFVENAIWHGLRYKKEKGNLAVSFIQKKNFVEITIKDNGIGRQQSKLVKTQNQKKMKSTGLKNVESRLEIIKTVFKKNLEISIEDLNPETTEGTIVTVNLYA